jgi:hypothetical protein
VSGRAGNGRPNSANTTSPIQLWLSLAVFVALTTFLATRHAMWRDEVRAFSVATQARSWLDLFGDIHQDGHPIIWYAILRAGYSVFHSPLVLPVAALVIAWIAAFLILRFAPFAFWIRILIVFGAFLGHEFSVVARNYGVGILFMMLACILFPTRGERPLRLGIVLALLANTSVHAALAAMLLGFVWIGTDLLDADSRRALARPASLGALAIGVAGVAFALWSAHVPPDMVYTVPLSRISPDKWRAIPLDPGKGLMGYQQANIAAAGALPWEHVGINATLACRVIVDIALLGIAWSLRRNPVCLAAMVLAIVAFEVIFRLMYSGSLRHEGMLAFFLISLVWIASEDSKREESERRQMALGLLALLFFQTVALPVTIRRVLIYPASSSRELAALIDRTPAWREAFLAGEPDYMMEPMPYYVGNKVFMPRQRAFDYRVYFDRGARRTQKLSLGGLLDVVDSLSCATRRPVLLAISYHKLLTDSSGRAELAYPGAEFSWNSAERSRLLTEGKQIGSFFRAIEDENYSVFELSPAAAGTCKANNPQ